MIWYAVRFWIIAGWLSATALNFPAGYKEKVDTPVGTEGKTTSESSSQPSVSLPVLSETPKEQASAALKETVVASAGVVSAPVASSPTTVSADSTIEEYRVQPEDILQITVYEEPDLTTKVRVAGSGEINFPLLGRVRVAGLSVIEVQEKVTRLLAEDYLVNPQVQVFIESYHARNVFVTGSVNKPGSYPLPPGKPTTLMEAITMAGGFSKAAAVNGTRIIRIENGHETTINVKANDIMKKGDKAKDVEVRPNDVIFVPESFF